MKKLLLSVLLSCLITCTLVSSVSAQLPYFTVNFDRLYYDVGSTGTVIINIQNNDQAFAYDIREMGFQLYLPRSDGTFFVTEFFGKNYTDSPLQIPAYDNVAVYIDFNIPQRSDLVSGLFCYGFKVYVKEQGTTTYSHFDSGQRVATSYDYNCILLSPESPPLPTPAIEPTPTPTPTPPPTPTPTPTPSPTPTSTPIDFFSVEVLFGIGIIAAVVIIILLVMLKKRKK